MNRTKVIVFVLMLVLLGTIIGYGATVRIGTDSSGDVWGMGDRHMIVAVNNGSYNSYLSNSANFLTAIYSLNNSDGTVYIPDNCNYTLTSELWIYYNITIQGGNNCTIFLDNNNAGINITCSSDDPSDYKCGDIRDVRILTKGSYTGTALTLYNPTGHYIMHQDLLDNIEVRNTGSTSTKQTGTGIKIHCHSQTGHNTGIVYNVFGSWHVHGFEYGVYIIAENDNNAMDTAYINANDFKFIETEHSKYHVTLWGKRYPSNSVKEIAGNTFHHITMQSESTATSICGLWLRHMITRNRFLYVFPWDWGNNPTAGQVNISEHPDNKKVYMNEIDGYFTFDAINSNCSTWIPNYVNTWQSQKISNGTCTVSSGQESVTVTHDCYLRKRIGGSGNDTSVQPFVFVFPGENLSTNGVSNYWIDTITSTQFTVNVDAVATGDITFNWYATLEHYFDDF